MYCKKVEKTVIPKTNFIPNCNIVVTHINNNYLLMACHITNYSQVGKGNVFPAQDLISYDREYESVMSWAFGQVLICTSMDAAEKVFNHPEIKRKAITVDGDVFDPSGVISGG